MPALTSQLFKRPFVMTIDIESWSSLIEFYNAQLNPAAADPEVGEEAGVSIILSLLEKHDVKATFFVLGDMVNRQTELIREIARAGHEIGSHGYSHGKNEFLDGIARQRKAIERTTLTIKQATGIQPKGFRAPFLRSNSDTILALMENNYLYDSSAIPTFVPGYYGQPTSRHAPYKIERANGSGNDKKTIIELPVSVNPFLPMSLSGSWMRNLGIGWVKFGVKTNFLRRYPVIFYIHPRELVPLPKVEGIPWHIYHNTGAKTENMLDEMLSYAKSLGAVFVKGEELAQSLQ